MVKLNYISYNREYQRLLDRTYHGKVIPIERYINGKSVLLHSCLGCYNEFYARPEWLLTKESQRHDCKNSRYESIAYSQIIKATVPKKKIPAELVQRIIELHNQGISNIEIARRTGINRKTVG
jgi:hypothetical protein